MLAGGRLEPIARERELKDQSSWPQPLLGVHHLPQTERAAEEYCISERERARVRERMCEFGCGRRAKLMRSATFRAHLEHLIKTDVRTWYICMYINPYQYLYVQTDTRVHVESYIYTHVLTDGRYEHCYQNGVLARIPHKDHALVGQGNVTRRHEPPVIGDLQND